MLSKENYLKLHGQFYDAFINLKRKPEQYLRFSEYKVPTNKAMGPRWFQYVMMIDGFGRELLNAINGYYTNLGKLEAWDSVLQTCSDDCRLNLIFEIINPFSTYVVNSVPMLRQRVIYVACMLCHQTHMLIDDTIYDGSLKERNIRASSLNRYKKIFSNINPFIKELKKIDNSSFREKTGEFRNLYHHRIPQKFELGLTGLINRIEHGDGKISYGIGGKQPLKISELIPILYNQHRACTNTFKALWNLIEEQITIFERKTHADDTFVYLHRDFFILSENNVFCALISHLKAFLIVLTTATTNYFLKNLLKSQGLTFFSLISAWSIL